MARRTIGSPRSQSPATDKNMPSVRPSISSIVMKRVPSVSSVEKMVTMRG